MPTKKQVQPLVSKVCEGVGVGVASPPPSVGPTGARAALPLFGAAACRPPSHGVLKPVAVLLLLLLLLLLLVCVWMCAWCGVLCCGVE